MFTFPYVPSPGDTPDWVAMDNVYNWLEPLKETPQDPVFHGEGNVYHHTCMVIEALIELDEWKSLDVTTRGILFWAALLHDIAKPICTKADLNGNILAPNHTIKGERMAREILYKGVPEPIPFDLREKIVKLVRYHGLPLWLMEQDDSLKKVIGASQMTNMKCLALLSESDVRGRICKDSDDLLGRISMFREYAKEAGCYDTSYPFRSDLARITYLNKKNGSPDYVPYDDSWGEVILMSGLPGAGKDTWIKSTVSQLPMVSLDDLRNELGIKPEDNQGKVVQTAKERARQFLRQKQPFIWNATNITRNIRKPLIDMFFSYGARVKIVYIEPAYNDLFKQNQNRESAVPDKIMLKLIHKLEVPTVDEANFINYVIDGWIIPHVHSPVYDVYES